MAYATQAEIRDEAGFTDNSYIENTTVDRALVAATSEINGVLAVAGYSLPISGTVGLLNQITRMLGAGHLLTRDYGVGADGTNKDGYALKKAARDLLQQILKREIILVDETGKQLLELANNSTEDRAAAEARPPIFNMEDDF